MKKSFPRALKHYFITGVFVLTPVTFTFVGIGWMVYMFDRLFGPALARLLGVNVPGLGLLSTLLFILLVGMLLCTNVVAQKVFGFFEWGLLHVPGVRAVYRTLKALTEAFSPENQKSFQNVVRVEYPHAGVWTIGFATRKVKMKSGGEEEPFVAVYVPTNHIYLGQTMLFPEKKVVVTSLSVQEGIQVVLSSGAGLPEKMT
jgi:uncharacterized membrane protein